MFGQVAGAEKSLAKLNQYVVTRINGRENAYWVLHTRAEDPVSVLIMSLNKRVEAERMTADEVFTVIGGILNYQTLTTKEQYEAKQATTLFSWEDSKQKSLHELASACKEAGAFGTEKTL